MITIDPTMPAQGNATTQSVRNNFAATIAALETLNAGIVAVLNVANAAVGIVGTRDPVIDRVANTLYRPLIAPAPALTSNYTHPANVIIFRPWIPPYTATINNVAAMVNISSGTILRIALYTDATMPPHHIPSQIYGQPADIDASHTGMQSAPANWNVAAGIPLWIATLCDGTPGVTAPNTTATAAPLGYTAAATAIRGYELSTTGANFPGTITATPPFDTSRAQPLIFAIN